MNEQELERFHSFVYGEGECWRWDGCHTRGGYGHFKYKGKMKLAHRMSYEHYVELIPVGLQLDHLCRVRDCVNPEHLEIVTNQENCRRGDTGRHMAERTHCPKGHPLDGENLYIAPNGCRNCKECRRENVRRHRAIKRG